MFAILLLPNPCFCARTIGAFPRRQPAVPSEQSQTRPRRRETPAAQTPAQQTPRGQLADRDNPLLIGKRNINKGQIDFYSIDKEVALGRQMPLR
jgi:hypothetical protein